MRWFSSPSHHRLSIVASCGYWSWRTSCGWRRCSSVACRRTGMPSTWRPPGRTRQATEFAYDAVLLDLMLPGMDGVEVCRQLRGAGRWVPVLMLTARDAVEDRVRGLDAGADDYLAKPFSFAE